jgi:hypothetical protein
MSATDLRFGRGAPRSEDDPLLTGRGRFTDDLKTAQHAQAAFVRSPLGHAKIGGVGAQAAAKMPGVLAVITGAELAREGLGAIPPGVLLPGKDGKPMFATAMPALAYERVRYVGEPVVLVVAETLPQALDAADTVQVDYEDLPAVAHVERALAPGAPLLYDAAPGNVALDWEHGDAAAVDAAFQAAAHKVAVRLADTRVAPSALEPRAASAGTNGHGETPREGVQIGSGGCGTYGGWNCFSSTLPRVLGFLEIYRAKRRWNGGLSGPTPIWPRQAPVARPGGCCPPRSPSPVLLHIPGCLLAQKKSTKCFAAFGLRLIWIFCNSKTGQKTATGTWHYVNRLVPKKI